MAHPKVERKCRRCEQPYFWENGKKSKLCPTCREIPYYASLKYEELSTPRAKKLRIVKERGHRCECCHLETWMGAPIPLELDHVDGDSSNEVKENVRLLCPNCHAQTPTYKARNRGRGRHFRRERYKTGKSY